MSAITLDEVEAYAVDATDEESPQIYKEIDMGFHRFYAEDGQPLQESCPCKCTCDCNRCGLPFG